MNNSDERDYADESDNRALLRESDELPEWDGEGMSVFPTIRRESDNPRNYLFVSESATQWVVWHIIGISVDNLNPANADVAMPNLDNGYIWPNAVHFWTFDACEKFMDETIKLWERLGESTEVNFI